MTWLKVTWEQNGLFILQILVMTDYSPSLRERTQAKAEAETMEKNGLLACSS